MRPLTREEMKETKGMAEGGTVCGCAETYMGAEYVGGTCRFDDEGNLIYRHCMYEY